MGLRLTKKIHLPVFNGCWNEESEGIKWERHLSSTALSSLTGSLQTVGPTGSGADIIWGALDLVPPWADLLWLSVYLAGTNASSGGDKMLALIWSPKYDWNDIYSDPYLTQTGDGNAVASELHTSLISGSCGPVPYFPNEFLPGARYTSGFTTTACQIYLDGYGRNGKNGSYVIP